MKRTILLSLAFILWLNSFVTSVQAQTLYGTTSEGGDYGGGTINKFMPASNNLTVVESFEHIAGRPYLANLIQGKDGKLYGMTRVGGKSNAGVIFSFDPANSAYTTLKDFDRINGAYPSGSVMQASDGKLYGMTASGGSKNGGVIFSFDAATSTYSS
jgi:uncharacterized repeat protein (TIGR03803 family)